MKTMRYGIQLPTSVYTRPDGSLLGPNGGASITVSGLPAGDFYQVDPAKGRVYFGTTLYAGKVAFRPAISNWRTTERDIDTILSVTRELAERLLAKKSGR